MYHCTVHSEDFPTHRMRSKKVEACVNTNGLLLFRLFRDGVVMIGGIRDVFFLKKMPKNVFPRGGATSSYEND